MYRRIVGIVLAMVWWLAMAAAEPYCNVTTYGLREGVPAGTGSRVVQDQYGFIWISTWNGLYRYDGHEFRPIRPDKDNDVRRYSSRFRDIKIGPEGRMWCRIDDNIVLFDVDTYRYDDLHSRIEKHLGERVRTDNAIRETTDGDIALTTLDGRMLVFDAGRIQNGEDPADAMKVISKDDPVKLKPAGYHKTPLPSSFDRNDMAYTAKDPEGNVWCINKDGRIMTSSSPDGTFKTVATIDTDGSAIKFSCEDNQGQVWMTSRAGIHRIALGTSSLTYITAPEPSQLRASMTDSHGRIWMAWSDSEYVTVSSDLNSTPSYLGADGRLSDTPVRFGMPVYCMAEGPDGEVWLGSKPDGLLRLTPLDGNPSKKVTFSQHGGGCKPPTHGYALITEGNYYDMAFDGKGRLWMATLGNGIEVMPNPSDSNPTIIPLINKKGYPRQADKVRRLRIIGDSLIVATTTEGLLSFQMPTNPEATDIAFMLHRTTPGNEHSLGNIATMDAIAGNDGRLYVATESDGLNILTTPLSAVRDNKWEFSSFNSDHPALAETTLTIGQLPDGRILAVGKQDINLLDPTGRKDIEILGPGFWKREVGFKEVSPLRLPDGRWLIGLDDGAAAIDLELDVATDETYPIEFTSYNIEGGPAMVLSPLTETITLKPNERAMTLTFAALSLSGDASVRYAYRLDDDKEWTALGNLRTLTFTRLTPGKHQISVRSTDLTGRWLDNEHTITIDVKPTFWETGWAKLLYAAISLSLIGGAIWLWLYMRAIKRRQRETLEAYLSLLEARTGTRTHEACVPTDDNANQPAKEPEPEINVNLSEEDKAMISKVVDFIERNFSDSGITVDDMAAAVAVSKSSLTRKMKSLMGVTPADFLKTTRLSKSKAMLKETDAPIKEIALDCGFSDMNYFGKCFKAAFGVTPTAWRSGEL